MRLKAERSGWPSGGNSEWQAGAGCQTAAAQLHDSRVAQLRLQGADQLRCRHGRLLQAPRVSWTWILQISSS